MPRPTIIIKNCFELDRKSKRNWNELPFFRGRSIRSCANFPRVTSIKEEAEDWHIFREGNCETHFWETAKMQIINFLGKLRRIFWMERKYSTVRFNLRMAFRKSYKCNQGKKLFLQSRKTSTRHNKWAPIFAKSKTRTTLLLFRSFSLEHVMRSTVSQRNFGQK